MRLFRHGIYWTGKRLESARTLEERRFTMTPAAHWKILDSEPEDLTVVEATSSPGPGGILMLESAYENVTELCSSVLEPGRHSGLPASHAAQQLKAWQKSRTPVGIHLADQLLLPLAMAGKGRFATCTSSDHTHSHSHLELIPRFLPVTEPSDGGVITISLRTTGRPGPSHPFLSHPRPSHLAP